ncbi:rCG52568 [Rattus norvegicus]|uniref:RCG52568 n=1 Tax=Rattus norvegicus TaxID=10116 RepID=A6IRW2_RAT|nr:rCG52568 [Rattus norvegicus]
MELPCLERREPGCHVRSQNDVTLRDPLLVTYFCQ